MINEAIKLAVEKKDLSFNLAKEAMNQIMSGDATDAQIAALITALRMKGETVDEISAFAQVMKEKCVKIRPKSKELIDTCGTGGDTKGTFNVSTSVAFVLAASGAKVAKHGNRAVSSKCGSADVLEALGVNIEIPPEKVAESIDEVGIGFLFAPMHHKAMKYAIGPRKEIAIRTVFNVLGPLTNPASAIYQLLGVYDQKLLKLIAAVLKQLGSKRAVVVHSNGLDELSPTGESKAVFLEDEEIKEKKISLADLGIKTASLDSLAGGNPKQNASILKQILKGNDKSPKRDTVILNTAAALMVCGKAKDFKSGCRLAEEILNSGLAYSKVEELKKFTNK